MKLNILLLFQNYIYILKYVLDYFIAETCFKELNEIVRFNKDTSLLEISNLDYFLYDPGLI